MKLSYEEMREAWEQAHKKPLVKILSEEQLGIWVDNFIMRNEEVMVFINEMEELYGLHRE